MALGQSSVKGGCELNLRGRISVDRWRNPERHQCFKTSEPLPIVEEGRIGHKVNHIGLVVTFEENASMCAFALDQAVQHLSRSRTAINVIAKKDLNRMTNRILYQIRIDALENLIEKIRPAMDIADRVNTNAIGHSRSQLFSQR